MKNLKRFSAFCITVILLFGILITPALAAVTIQLKESNPLTPSSSNKYGTMSKPHPLNSAQTFDVGFYAEGKVSANVAGGTSVIVKGMIRATYDSAYWKVCTGQAKTIKIWSTINTNGNNVTIETARGSYGVRAWNLNLNQQAAIYGSADLSTTYWSKYF
ncbi:MAG: hypothetical protein LBO63_06520 [Oscillospiraceae bacterium]|jgi:hypothetical protein|nr:hypothetical protein [Oscillospiraceae bacterium]